MDFGAILSVIQTLLAALQCSELKEAWSVWGYKSELDELSSTVATVKKVLLDAEAKHEELSHETQLYIEELTDALYDADDLLDEFVTLTKQKQQLLTENRDGKEDKFSKKVRMFFSRYNQLGVAYNMSHGVKKIMKKLDGIASKHRKFGLGIDNTPIRRRRNETCSYIDTRIIGRDEDLEKIVGMLVDDLDAENGVQRDVSFVTIVGMGGLGKTALAQLVYNDDRVARKFPLKLWTCVSDQDQRQLDVKGIMGQIVESATGEKLDCGSSMEVVLSRFRRVIEEKRFLIVLDDVWTENRDEWCKLVGHLVGSEKGSRVLVTTRSKETAKIVGNGSMYELRGLSEQDSWRLFQLMAFEQVLDQANPNHPYLDFINIGQEIVKKCGNVPLAIRVVGSLLYGQERSKWLSFQEFGLANLRESEDKIKPILKLSYHNLESPLKSCFSYCAMFPKDFPMSKNLLISLWIAQGYVVPFEKGQSIEDAAEEYFMILLRRCFFQDVSMLDGSAYMFGMHDLMHDIAQEVAEKELCVAGRFTGDVLEKVRHVSVSGKQSFANLSFTKARIRSYLHVDPIYVTEMNEYPVDALLASYRYLRALDLCNLRIKSLPASIFKLIHLRYLNLTGNDSIEILPKSITKLYNLQFLNASGCSKLKELPKDLSKLVNLKYLRLFGCQRLTFMPLGMGKLTNLSYLSTFVVGERNSMLEQHTELEGLKPLKNLRGSIDIVIHFPKSGAVVKSNYKGDGAYIMNKEHLNSIRLECKHEEISSGASEYEEELLGALRPHANLKKLEGVGYQGVRMPRWGKEYNLGVFLPNLVHLKLNRCSELQCLPSLGKLHYLKSLSLHALSNMRYVESYPTTASVLPESSEEGLFYLPCLESLYLADLPKLQGWWSKSGKEPSCQSLALPLTGLRISKCPELTFLPCCPNLEVLHLSIFNARLQIVMNTGRDSTSCPKLRMVRIDNIAWLRSSLPMDAIQGLSSLTLHRDMEVESLSEFGKVLSPYLSSLRTFQVSECPKLRSISGGLRSLIALEKLYLSSLPIKSLADQEFGQEDEDNSMPWGSLCDTLQCLIISKCEQLQSFPRWMQKLTSLRKIEAWDGPVGLYE